MPKRLDPSPDSGAASSASSFVVLRDLPDPIRGEDGTWRYGNTGVAVPAAEDVTVADTVDYRVVADREGQPEAVLVARATVDADDDLGWVPTASRLLRDADDARNDLYEIDLAVWQERSAKPVRIRAPEFDGSGLRRLMACEERDLRLLRKATDVRSERRTRLIALAARLGMTRREIGDVIGLSPGRVQQVLEDMPETVRLETEETATDILEVLRMVGPRTVTRDDADLLAARGAEFVDELLAIGILEPAGRRSKGLRVSEEGGRVELHLRDEPKKKRPRRRS